MKLKSLRSSRLGVGAAAAALIGAAVLVPASAAYASGTPTVSEFDCDSYGAGQFACTIFIGGGTSPYTSYWQAGANVTSISSQGESYALGYCVQGQAAEITVLVRDYVGATGTASDGFTCA